MAITIKTVISLKAEIMVIVKEKILFFTLLKVTNNYIEIDGQHHSMYLRDTDPECMYELYELYIFNVTYIFQPAAYSTTHISTQYLHNIYTLCPTS